MKLLCNHFNSIIIIILLLLLSKLRYKYSKSYYYEDKNMFVWICLHISMYIYKVDNVVVWIMWWLDLTFNLISSKNNF